MSISFFGSESDGPLVGTVNISEPFVGTAKTTMVSLFIVVVVVATLADDFAPSLLLCSLHMVVLQFYDEVILLVANNESWDE